jgi:uncharacterized protein
MIGGDQDEPAFDIPSAAILPDRPFPPYAYAPGDTPHPTRDPRGHSYAAGFEIPERPDPEEWRACRDYLYGIDLFNHGFYWEAHEVWEGLWVACGRRGPNLPAGVAAAGLKARSGSARGMRANAGKAVRLFGRGSYCRAASWPSITERWRGRRYSPPMHLSALSLGQPVQVP